LTVPAVQEAFTQTLARIVRLRFLEWTVWTLPLTAHEFGHVVIREDADLQAFAQAEFEEGQDRYENLNELYVLLADAFATYTMGPAYACAAIMLRLDPITFPTDIKRGYIVLNMLSRMSAEAGGLTPPYEGVVRILEDKWDSVLKQTKRADALEDTDKDALKELTDSSWESFDIALRSTAPYPATGRASGWGIAEDWGKILKDADSEKKIPTTFQSHLRDVLNAGWACRLASPEMTALGINRVAKLVESLCKRIIEGRRQVLLAAAEGQVGDGGRSGDMATDVRK
jgi:hypothetical protein